MGTITIPFKEQFKQALLDGQKTMTSRTKKYGKPGDTFSIYGGTFVIKHIEKKSLRDVAEQHYAEEGVDTPEAFRNVWIRLHPIKGFDAEQDVYVHTFERI